ncbi:MAG: sugar phosphate isomerase/epimerase [Limnochordia bacterium]|jgi:L-ribulose-5-phosphate 3-epimerase|nr:sugar phosphate isomerase/epimerase [Limnochordia bacterium]MDD2628752.1 sugar phosphate isomerase/epimerase [Limnochordia bacterium]MDD4517120.1 sugar phosphate isomerase/epimerase [Limnochordia bacterium]
MKKSISIWMFPEDWTLEQICQTTKDAGYDAIELSFNEVGPLSLKGTEKDALQVKETVEKAGLEIASLASGLFWTYSLTSDDATTRQKAKDIVKGMLQAAHWLGTDCILVVPGAVDVFFNPASEVVPYDVVYERSLAALKELAPVAEDFKVSIGLENVWNKFLLSPLEMARFIDEIDSPYVGAYFDAGNVLFAGYPQDWIRILGDRIKRVHIKDYRKSIGNADGFVNLLEGDVPWPEVMKALKDIGYTGYVTAEVLPPYKYDGGQLAHDACAAMNKIFQL